MKPGSFLLLFCLPWCALSVTAAPEAVIAENDQVRFVFSREPVPQLQQLVHKPSGVNLLAGAETPSWFALEVPKANGEPTLVLSGQAKQGSVHVEPVPTGQRIRLEYSGLGPAADIAVKIEGHLDKAEPVARWSVAVDNPGRQPLVAVRFPYVAAVPAIGSPGDDFIVAPAFPGVLFETPDKSWPARYASKWSFPGTQSLQFLSYQDGTAGVYLASQDTAGHARDLCIAKQGGKEYLLYQKYRLPEEPAAEWRSPYDVVLGVTSGTWQQTADIYKRWAVQQPWCAKTLDKRDDIPDYWKHGPCIHTVGVRTYDPKTRVCSGSYYPELAEHLRLFREKIDGPVVPMLPSWENHRRWTAGEYFPIFDQQQAKGVLAQIRHNGFRPFVFLSGLFYTFQNEGRDGGDLSGWKRYADSLVLDASGKPTTNVLNESSPDKTNIWKRHSYQLCPAAPGTKEFFRSVIDQLHALGIDIVQMDQATSGMGGVCYSTEHGHPPGEGLYRSETFRDLLADMGQHGRSLSREFLLMNEELHEELIPYLGGFHTREHKEYWWYRGAPGARGIPLFTYLYHEYAIAYGGEGPSLRKRQDNATVRNMAVNLVTGKTPAASVWSSQSAMAEAHADQFKMLRNHSHLLKTEAQRFLMLGRMLHTLEFDTPSVTLQIFAKRDGEWKPIPLEERSVLSSSWQSPEGNVGHCLVNITHEKQVLRLQLDTRNAPGWPKTDIDLYRADKPEKAEPQCRGAALPHVQTIELSSAGGRVLRDASRRGLSHRVRCGEVRGCRASGLPIPLGLAGLETASVVSAYPLRAH